VHIVIVVPEAAVVAADIVVAAGAGVNRIQSKMFTCKVYLPGDNP
jgi:hypothetical protein